VDISDFILCGWNNLEDINMKGVMTKNRKPCSLTIDKDVWRLVDHFLPAGESKSSFTEKALLSLIVDNMDGLIHMIETYRETQPEECFLYEAWIMRVGLSKYYNEQRELWFKKMESSTQGGITHKPLEKGDKSSNINPLTPPHKRFPIQPPYGKFHSLLNKGFGMKDVEPDALTKRKRHVLGLIHNPDSDDEFMDESRGTLWKDRRGVTRNLRGVEQFESSDDGDAEKDNSLEGDEDDGGEML